MTFDVSDGVVIGIIGTFFTVAGKVLWAVGNQVIASLKSGDASRVTMVETQTKILDRMDETAKENSSAKALDRLRRGMARTHPSMLLCDVCHNWIGPDDMLPSGIRPCLCSDPPPATNRKG